MEKWVWLSLVRNDLAEIERIISDLANDKFTGVHLSGTPELIEDFSQKSQERNIKTNVWFWALINNDAEIGAKHPDWFNVSREGNSSLTHPPYVGYYKWLCPNKIEVQAFLLNKLEKLCKNTSVNGIHLDYIRYPDVILPEAIQPKYGLVQNTEQPQFDYCYCETCRDLYKKETGVDPLLLEAPEKEPDWVKFRLKSVNQLVNQVSEVVHLQDKELSAAVFPHPETAIKLVRQDWTKWRLDAVFPMIYYKFYKKSYTWITEIINDLLEKYHYQIPIYPGIYLPEMSFSEYKKIEDLILSNQLPGMSLFDYSSLQGSDIKNRNDN